MSSAVLTAIDAPRDRRASPGLREHEARGSRQTVALVAAVLGFFVVTLDAVVVNVALPTVRRDFAAGISGLQWVVDGYTLMFAALLMWSGALTDRIGARRGFTAGLGLFVAASAACGMTPTPARSSWPGSCRAQRPR